MTAPDLARFAAPAAGAGLLLFWLGLGWLYREGARQVRRLSEVGSDLPAAGRLPSLSIVITARDEAPAIEATVRRALAQAYPRLEVIAVDDRSTDGTGALLDRLAAEWAAAGESGTGGIAADGAAGDRTAGGPPRGGAVARTRFSVIHVLEIPSGWLGKCHACVVGARQAGGDLLLFLDADVTLERDDLLSRVAGWMERERIDHAAVFPDLRPVGLLQAGLLSAFEQAMLFASRAWEMDRDRPRGGAGVGAFNLMRRAAYERIGGHSLLRMEIADDYKMGMLLKESGARQRLLHGEGLVRCPWHRGTAATIRGLEKNLFAGVEYSVVAVLWQSALAILTYAGPPALALALGRTAPWLWLPLAAQVASLALVARGAGERLGHRWPLLMAMAPLSVTLLLAAVWNSTLTTLRHGGVRWRGTFYPLAELRRGAVRPGSGRRFLVRRGNGLL